jgi:catechol 2,3-dioxygenase-like lactoylglutathione lyase family enzyme
VNTRRSRVEGISAVTLVTADMATAVSFYLSLGLELVYRGPTARFTSLRAGTGHINLELRANQSGPNSRWGRVVLWVDDVDAMYRRVVDAGLTPTASPTDASWGERYFHLHDPDGHELSFARPLPSPD